LTSKKDIVDNMMESALQISSSSMVDSVDIDWELRHMAKCAEQLGGYLGMRVYDIVWKAIETNNKNIEGVGIMGATMINNYILDCLDAVKAELKEEGYEID